MRSEVRLDSAVFQLTPTRTRCDLVIISNGKTEKVASGLLNPFLAHLKAAQDQIVKGGYSITLEPDPNKDAEWFTKGTIERFVRFVSTPEVLERVNTIESEIVQIEEAITVQGNESVGTAAVENHQAKPTDSIEGSRPANNVADAEKAIVLFKPGSHAPDSNGSIAQEENSKVHLLRVLETRKTVLQKEQGMAFARAVAAGFDMDHMLQLISFAECFGATRMMEACIRFMDLWKVKHESGQWLEIEAAEALSSRSEFSSLNVSGIILSGDINKQREFGEGWPISNGDLGAESNGKDGLNASEVNSGLNKDRRSPDDHHTPSGPHDYYQGQFQHPMFPQWPIHSAPGAPMFQPYPVQSMPYYQNYPGGGPFFQPPYPPMDDPRYTTSHRMGQKRSSMDSKDSTTEPEAWEMGASGARSKDFSDRNLSEDEKEIYHARGSRKRSGHSGKKKRSGKAATRTSKRYDTSESESESASDSETEEDSEHDKSPRRKHKHSSRSKKKNSQTKSVDVSDIHDKDEVAAGQGADSGSWQVFQSFLMRDEEKTSNVDRGMFSGEQEPPMRRKESKVSDDPFLPPERDADNVQDLKVVDGITSRLKQISSTDELLLSTGRGYTQNNPDPQFEEIEGGRGRRTSAHDEFMVYGPEKQLINKRFSDPLAETEFEHAVHVEKQKQATYNATDESFIVPFRSDIPEELLADSRPPLEMDSELPYVIQGSEDSSSKPKDQFYYEPHDLSLMPEREMENESVGYDPAIDYDMEIHIEDAAKVNTSNHEDDQSNTKEEPMKSNKEKKPRAGQDVTDKRKMDLMRKGRLSKPNPLADAQARAEKLRSYKADLQKLKKEKEEEAIKRLEALKLERQRRIAARSGSVPSQSTSTPQQTKARPTAKVSPGSYKGSKFNDIEASSSPMAKFPGRTTSLGSNDSHITTTKTSKPNLGTPVVGNELSRSVSSLPDLNKESDGLGLEVKAASRVAKRLSDPKFSNNSHASPKKSVSSDRTPKKTASDEPNKKMPAIMHSDKTKSATLPELKIKTSKGPSDSVQKVSANKEAGQKVTGTKNSLTSQTNGAKVTNGKTSKLSNGDECPDCRQSNHDA
ncbi:beta-sandwich domain of Sec23/24 domain-containing protein [Dioscorea alata]|uniref:Beta-sandwich domain of Sec23/24 domain-containing protein n=1 Tax=Dioscorea alata TaxID=55571 RepID=A0ACB7V8N6_DIOAL|nr:beta-sandwich domain of Sec23/24 domain-containing protein [Dioscorea alata]